MVDTDDTRPTTDNTRGMALAQMYYNKFNYKSPTQVVLQTQEL